MTSPDSVVNAASASRRTVRAIAMVEALKGIVVLVAATGVLGLIHRDLNDLAARLVAHAHLNPAAKYPHVFLQAVSHLEETRLLWLAAGAVAYSSLRLVEAYGLYLERAWAEWLAALSAGIYVPGEAYELVHKPSAIGAAVLLLNAAVVAVMVRALRQRRAGHAAARGPIVPPPPSEEA